MSYLNEHHGYGIVPLSEATDQAWRDGFEIVTPHGHLTNIEDPETFVQTHWIIEDCHVCEPADMADIVAKGGAVFASAEYLINHIQTLNE